MRIALIGNGKMGSALLTQWAGSTDAGRTLPDHTFFVIDPASEPGSGAEAEHVTYLREAPPVDQCAFDLVIVAVKPQIVDAVLPGYAPRLAPGGFVASIAAGCSIARLRALAGGVPVIRIMPNLPAAIGAGVSGLCADSSASQAQRDAVEAMMAAAGITQWVDDEDQLDRFTAIAGSGPGYVFEIARTYVEAAEALGFSPEDARRLVLGTMAGTVAMARQSAESLEDLRTSVTSKNGTTAAGLAVLNGDGALGVRLQATVEAAYQRAIALR
ncbi:MAG: pyrroline-5-carboxylate reductase [Sphingomonadales bacterium]|nr:pyrroline-5-carboxylate reductase [Sphingomonadales bacterium]